MASLAKKATSDSPRRMGRLPLGESADDTKATPVRIDAALRGRIDAARGKQPVAAYIRDAVVEKLDRENITSS